MAAPTEADIRHVVRALETLAEEASKLRAAAEAIVRELAAGSRPSPDMFSGVGAPGVLTEARDDHKPVG